jgi:hypothetical protein
VCVGGGFMPSRLTERKSNPHSYILTSAKILTRHGILNVAIASLMLRDILFLCELFN